VVSRNPKIKVCDICGEPVGDEGFSNPTNGYCAKHLSSRRIFSKKYCGKKSKLYEFGIPITGGLPGILDGKKESSHLDYFDSDGRL